MAGREGGREGGRDTAIIRNRPCYMSRYEEGHIVITRMDTVVCFSSGLISSVISPSQVKPTGMIEKRRGRRGRRGGGGRKRGFWTILDE